MTNDNRNIAEQLLNLAQKSGAEEAEVYQVRSQSHPVFFEANRLKQLETSESEGIALRLWREGCPGLAIAYGQIEPEKLVEKAIALSQLNPPEAIELTEKSTLNYPQSVGIEIPVKTLVEMGENALSQIRETNQDLLCGADLDCEQETTTLITTKGLSCQYTDISLSCSVGAEWVRGEDFLAVYDGQEARNQLDINSIVQSILKRLAWAQENALAPSGRIPILFTAKAATLFWDTIEEAMNGKRVLEQSSPWSDRLSQVVLSESLTLSQQPNQGPFSCPFDDEGIATKPLSLISQGRLEQFYSDRTIGKALGIGSTGNGFRPGLSRYPTPSLVNLWIEPGKLSFPDLVKSLNNGLIVDQMLGGGADISGDFSINVDLGYRVENGKIIGRVKDTMVAGNIYKALNQIVALGNDNEWNGSCYTPSLIVEGLSVISSE